MGVGKGASIKSLIFLKNSLGKQQMPVVRHHQFNFREGFCWNNLLNPEARLLKVKIKGASVNDVGSMSLIPFNHMPSSKYFVALLNSNLLFDIYREFINCSVNIQINDIRLIPVIIPTQQQHSAIEKLVNQAIIYRNQIEENPVSVKMKTQLLDLEEKIDKMVESIYTIKLFR